MGVSSCGKTTIGKTLSSKISLPFFDGDDYHPPENISKMESGLALNDDREVWLKTLNHLALREKSNKGAIIACSALKQLYRNVLTSGLNDHYLFIFLKGGLQTIKQRMEKRSEHFMPIELLQAQFDDLEEPRDEPGTLIIDISQSPQEICQRILMKLK